MKKKWKMICLNSFINKILYTKYTLYFILKVNDYHLNVDNYIIVVAIEEVVVEEVEEVDTFVVVMVVAVFVALVDMVIVEYSVDNK